VYDQLEAMRGENDDPVFRSLQGGHLDPAQVHRIVKAAAKRAELPITTLPAISGLPTQLLEVVSNRDC